MILYDRILLRFFLTEYDQDSVLFLYVSLKLNEKLILCM